jgi:O-antigen/teichoic acid export membrane protein
MSQLKRRWFANASANVVGGVFTTIFNLLLPAMLARHLSTTDFSVWNLILQVVVYLQIFSAGLQTAIAKYISVANERNDLDDQILSIGAAARVSMICTGLAVGAVFCLYWGYPLVFKDIPEQSIHDFRLCILMIGLSSSLQLFSLLPGGIFLGRHRNILWIACQITTKSLSLAGIYFVSNQGGGLLQYSAVFAATGFLILPLTFFVVYKTYPELWKFTETSRARFSELASYCASLSVWGISMLMVGGLSIALVGYFDFENISSYAISTSLVGIMLGVLTSLMSPMMANFAALSTSSEGREKMPKLLNKVTVVMVAAMLVGLVGMIFAAKPFLSHWVGSRYVNSAYPIVVILSFSAAVRNLGLPYSMLILATGVPKIATTGVLLEGAMSIMFSIMFGSEFGAIGVSYGVLLSSILGLIYNSIFVFPAAKCIDGADKYVARYIYSSFISIVLVLALYFLWME